MGASEIQKDTCWEVAGGCFYESGCDNYCEACDFSIENLDDYIERFPSHYERVEFLQKEKLENQLLTIYWQGL